MKTIISKDIHLAATLLREGNVVAIPTETVYGLAGNALDPSCVSKIFAVKNRPFFDPLIVHIRSVEALHEYTKDIPDIALELAKTFWPGPLTLVLKRKSMIPDLVTSGLETVAIRVPAHPVAAELLAQLDFPLAAPSANPFGYISPTTAAHVASQLNGSIPMILDGGACKVGLESTIVDCSGKQIRVLRAGGLSIEALEKHTGKIDIVAGSSSNPAAPGMLESHYAPRKPLYLGDPQKLMIRFKNEKIAILSFQKKYPVEHNLVLSDSGDLTESAQNLFGYLRQLDQLNVDKIIAEEVPDIGLGRAINDRLKRASIKLGLN